LPSPGAGATAAVFDASLESALLHAAISAAHVKTRREVVFISGLVAAHTGPRSDFLRAV
jgi:hypothetical protein